MSDHLEQKIDWDRNSQGALRAAHMNPPNRRDYEGLFPNLGKSSKENKTNTADYLLVEGGCEPNHRRSTSAVAGSFLHRRHPPQYCAAVAEGSGRR